MDAHTSITIAGKGFVAGRTACKFGSGSAFTAEVVSSEEARCVAPAGVRGSVSVEVSMGVSMEAALVSSSGVMFKYEGAASVLEVSPTMTVVEGGSVVSMVVSGVEDGSKAWCKVGGRVVVAAGSVNSGIVQCVSVAGVLGNTTVEVSVNGQEFTSSGIWHYFF